MSKEVKFESYEALKELYKEVTAEGKSVEDLNKKLNDVRIKIASPYDELKQSQLKKLREQKRDFLKKGKSGSPEALEVQKDLKELEKLVEEFCTTHIGDSTVTSLNEGNVTNLAIKAKLVTTKEPVEKVAKELNTEIPKEMAEAIRAEKYSADEVKLMKELKDLTLHWLELNSEIDTAEQKEELKQVLDELNNKNETVKKAINYLSNSLWKDESTEEKVNLIDELIDGKTNTSDSKGKKPNFYKIGDCESKKIGKLLAMVLHKNGVTKVQEGVFSLKEGENEVIGEDENGKRRNMGYKAAYEWLQKVLPNVDLPAQEVRHNGVVMSASEHYAKTRK